MKNQINLLLILLLTMSATVFSVAGWHEYKNNAKLTQLLENECDKRWAVDREILYKRLQREIEEEELNEAVFINSKLRDTLQYIRIRTAHFFSDSVNASSEEFQAWGEELNHIYRSEFFTPERANDLKNLTLNDRATPAEKKIRLMQWEKETLEAFESRFNGRCTGSFLSDCFTLGLRPDDQQGFEVEEGDYFKAEVVAYVRPDGEKPFEASMGSIEMSDCATARLRIPTEGLLAPGEMQKKVHFTASAGFRNIFGELRRISTEKSFVVVRK